MGEIFGAIIGAPLGEKIRRAYFRRKLKRAEDGSRLKVRVRAHPTGSPDWRYWRGALVGHGESLRVRALVRRWRSCDLKSAHVIGTRIKRSVADGDRKLIEFRGAVRVDHLAVSIDGAAAAEALLRRAAKAT